MDHSALSSWNVDSRIATECLQKRRPRSLSGRRGKSAGTAACDPQCAGSQAMTYIGVLTNCALVFCTSNALIKGREPSDWVLRISMLFLSEHVLVLLMRWPAQDPARARAQSVHARPPAHA